MASKTYEIEGVVKVVEDMQTFDSGFTKREFVVTTEEDYPQDVKLECVKDRCSLLDNVSVGDRVMAAFNLRGNEYNGRYYVNLQAWRLSKLEDGSNAKAAVAASPAEDDNLTLDDSDNEPF